MAFNLQDFLSGMASAAASRGVLRREPIAYLYNGVQLPGLPESEYEYAVIDTAMYTMLGKATLYLFSTLEYTTIESSGDRGLVLADTNHVRYTAKSTDTTWSETSAGTTALNINNIGWANTNILNADGSVFLDGSDPVPIYE